MKIIQNIGAFRVNYLRYYASLTSQKGEFDQIPSYKLIPTYFFENIFQQCVKFVHIYGFSDRGTDCQYGGRVEDARFCNMQS